MELKSKIRIRFILFRALVILLTVAVAGLAAGLIGYILKKGLPYVSWEFLTTEPDILMDTYGIKPMIINTIYTVVLTLLFCIPLGIGSAIYLAEYAKQGKIVSAIRFAIEILAGIPSIVYGLFGLDFFVRKMSIGDYAGSMLAASLTLTLIVLPTMIRTTEESLLAVSSSYREAAAAMGLSKFYTIRKVILPCAISGIVVAIILSIGRMISESAALLYTAGIAQDLPTSVLSHVKEPGATMTVQLYLYATEGGAPEWVPYAMAAVLMLFVLFIEILTHLIAGIFARRKKERIDVMSIVSTKELNLSYGKHHVLKDVSMDIERNEITALIGPSGCGKSTFLKTLNRMNDLVPDCHITGQVLFEGTDIYSRKVDAAALRKKVGMVFQKANPFPASIYDNIAYAPKYHGVRGRKKLDEIVETSLRKAALWDEVKDRLKKSALGLSGGQQQRLCIARTIALEPEIILMDEATSALDPISTQKMEELMVELKKNYTVIIVTHNMQQAARVADKTAFFFMGDLIEYGPTSQIFENPVEEKTKAYVSGQFG